MDRKTNRSGKYQSFFTELPYSNDMMADFSIGQGLSDLYSAGDRELLIELREELRLEFWRIVEEQLTSRQKQILKLLAKGYTQIEIAKQLNVNQSSITKSVNGNCDYRNGRRVYGGAKRKLKKLCSTDEKIKDIMARIEEIDSQYDI